MDKELRGQRTISMDDKVTRNDDGRSGVSEGMNQVFKFPGKEGK